LKGALLVNPYDVEGTANAIAKGLAMSLEERRDRWSMMMEHLLTHDVSLWCENFLGDLVLAPELQPERDSRIGS
jgi:trehalose 6-phosphate synthase